MILLLLSLLVPALVERGLVQDQPPRPTIRSGVELITIDVQVVDDDGYPFTGLTANDFEVWIDNRKRSVVSIELVRHRGAQSVRQRVTQDDPAKAPERQEPTGRLFVLAIDEHSFRMPAAQAAAQAAQRFLDTLRPDDLVGLYAYPTGRAHVDMTTDHQKVREALGGIMGLADRVRSEFNLTAGEIIDIASFDGQALDRVVQRECNATDRSCRRRIQEDAMSLATMLEMKIAQSLGGLRALIAGLKNVSGRKTVVLVSGGLLASDRGGGRVSATSDSIEVGRAAAAANISLYVLHMDSTFLEAFSADGGGAPPSLFRDAGMMATGLELVAGGAGGSVVRVQAGSGESAFERIARETSARYVLGVEVQDSDRDGSPHTVRVRVNKRGAKVRSRSSITIPAAR
jgi:VWFA-related protein